MSLPRQIPPSRKSPVPAKSSLRQPSTEHGSAPRSLLPSPHFEETIPRSPPRDEHDERQSGRSVDSSGERNLDDEVEHSLQPFFILVQDTTTGDHYHPTAHYLFIDDDEDFLTEATLKALEQLDATEVLDEPGLEKDSRGKFSVARSADRCLLLDLSFDVEGSGVTVRNAQCLSSEWQIDTTHLSEAPTLNEKDNHGDSGLMLKVEGSSRGLHDLQVPEGSADELTETFRARLLDIRSVMNAMKKGVEDSHSEDG